MGPFLQAPSRVLWCLVEWLVLLQPIKLPRLVRWCLSPGQEWESEPAP